MVGRKRSPFCYRGFGRARPDIRIRNTVGRALDYSNSPKSSGSEDFLELYVETVF